MQNAAQIKLDQQKGQAELLAERQKLDAWEKELQDIIDILVPLQNKLDEAISANVA